MMKRILACLVAVACLLTAFATIALADGTSDIGTVPTAVTLVFY